jgi:hypothetical protein
VYVISHNRTMAEILAPTRKPIAEEFERNFAGMTIEPVALADLELARETIIKMMVANMPQEHRNFLMGFKRGEPDWALLGLHDVQRLPAVQWKQRNLALLPTIKRNELADRLKKILLP